MTMIKDTTAGGVEVADPRRTEQLRIQQLGAGISRRDWYWTEKAYEAIRDEFDRRPVLAASPAPAPAAGVDVVLAEVERATAKFPTWPTDPLHALSVLGEEFGELTKETLQLTYEPHKSTVADFRKEAIQTAAMALRFVASLDSYQFTAGVQHKQENRS